MTETETQNPDIDPSSEMDPDQIFLDQSHERTSFEEIEPNSQHTKPETHTEDQARHEIEITYGTEGWQKFEAIDKSIKTIFDPERQDTYTENEKGEKEYTKDSPFYNPDHERFILELTTTGKSIDNFIDEKSGTETAFLAFLNEQNEVEYHTYSRTIETEILISNPDYENLDIHPSQDSKNDNEQLPVIQEIDLDEFFTGIEPQTFVEQSTVEFISHNEPIAVPITTPHSNTPTAKVDQPLLLFSKQEEQRTLTPLSEEFVGISLEFSDVPKTQQEIHTTFTREPEIVNYLPATENAIKSHTENINAPTIPEVVTMYHEPLAVQPSVATNSPLLQPSRVARNIESNPDRITNTIYIPKTIQPETTQSHKPQKQEASINQEITLEAVQNTTTKQPNTSIARATNSRLQNRIDVQAQDKEQQQNVLFTPPASPRANPNKDTSIFIQKKYGPEMKMTTNTSKELSDPVPVKATIKKSVRTPKEQIFSVTKNIEKTTPKPEATITENKPSNLQRQTESSKPISIRRTVLPKTRSLPTLESIYKIKTAGKNREAKQDSTASTKDEPRPQLLKLVQQSQKTIRTPFPIIEKNVIQQAVEALRTPNQKQVLSVQPKRITQYTDRKFTIKLPTTETSKLKVVNIAKPDIISPTKPRTSPQSYKPLGFTPEEVAETESLKIPSLIQILKAA